MFNSKVLLLIVLTFAATSCNNTHEEKQNTESTEMHETAAEAGEEEEGEKNLKFDPFEESITSKINGLKIVQDETRRVDSISKGSRHLEYHVVKDPKRSQVYTVRVYEFTGKDTLDHFRFHVDSLTGNIMNPDGRH